MYKDWQFWAALTLRHGRKQEAPGKSDKHRIYTKTPSKGKKKKKKKKVSCD